MNEQPDDDLPARPEADFSRREFVALSVATGLAVAAGPAQAALPVGETEVSIKTTDGTCDERSSTLSTASIRPC